MTHCFLPQPAHIPPTADLHCLRAEPWTAPPPCHAPTATALSAKLRGSVPLCIQNRLSEASGHGKWLIEQSTQSQGVGAKTTRDNRGAKSSGNDALVGRDRYLIED